jgi:Cysteine rich repeat
MLFGRYWTVTMKRFDRVVMRIVPLVAVLLALSVPAAAQQPSEAQRNAIRQACPADYQAHCADVPTGGKAALSCLQRNAASLSAACQRAVKAVSAGGAAPHSAPASGTATTTPAPAPAARSLPAMSRREQMMVLRQSCAGDYRALCGGVPLGGGRAIACLRAHAGSLSPQCGGALSAARQNR